MAAKKWILNYEVAFKLHSGIRHEEFILKANDFDEGLKRVTSCINRFAKANECIFMGAVLKDAKLAWQPVISGVDVPN